MRTALCIYIAVLLGEELLKVVEDGYCIALTNIPTLTSFAVVLSRSATVIVAMIYPTNRESIQV